MKKYKKFSIATIILLLVVGGGVGYWVYFNRDKTDQLTTNEAINYRPPTEEEQQSGNSQKDRAIQEEDSRNNSPDPNKQTASVVITDAAQYDNTVEVRAFIPNHYQDGSCIITFTQGNQKVEKSTPAYRDASTTICTNPLLDRSEFSISGNWQVVVSYKAGDVWGKSEPKTIAIK